MILPYFENLGNYSPLIAIALYIVYYLLSNSFISLILIFVGVFIGVYMNRMMNDNINYFNSIFR
jgi:uncharacterized membrane protein